MIDRMELLAVITLGFLMDQVLGDPHWLYHPVRLIGTYISFLEKEYGRSSETGNGRCLRAASSLSFL